MTSLIETVFTSIVVGILSSIVASAMFLYILFRIKPSVEISPYIAIQKTNDGSTKYVFKIINRTPREIINVRFHLVLSTYRNVPGGKITKNENIPLVRSEVFRIAPYNKKDKDADYALRITCLEDLDKLWSDENGRHLKLRVIATDSLTSFSKVFIKTFHEKRTTLVTGSHKFGDSLDIS